MTPPALIRRRFQFGLKGLGLLLATAVLGLLFAYVGSYYRISRRGMEEARRINSPGFLYVSQDELWQSQTYERHYRIERFFMPANWINYYLFDGMPPITGGTLRLVGDNPPAADRSESAR